jgi:membrane protein YdbS with pleckstrin-like domain
MSTEKAEGHYTNTIGSIVSWAIFRAAGVIVAAYIVSEYVSWLDYSTWWLLTLVMFYAVVLHPMQIQYRIYREETAKVMDGTLCSTCRHFEPTGVLCAKLDEHVSEDNIPCEGELWEPK